MKPKSSSCRYGHSDTYHYVSKSGRNRSCCRVCKKEQSVASRVGSGSKHAPAMVAKYDLKIMEAEIKIAEIRKRIEHLNKMRDRYSVKNN